ncbi:hypothetical protein CDL15_Pgr002223 [Punica granatum]|uniref:Uncharacterized protein n=1 Tax=Punica granatum TaxID=22663 RepID=A0A218XCX3_PUNGR|nr:hypothetical protein CDL15_Pgr002223 [Punica granatum]
MMFVIRLFFLPCKKALGDGTRSQRQLLDRAKKGRWLFPWPRNLGSPKNCHRFLSGSFKEHLFPTLSEVEAQAGRALELREAMQMADGGEQETTAGVIPFPTKITLRSTTAVLVVPTEIGCRSKSVATRRPSMLYTTLTVYTPPCKHAPYIKFYL